jgi:hypothetical protein
MLPIEYDGLGSFDQSQMGGKASAFGGARILKFMQGTYHTTLGEVVEPARELVSLGLAKIVQKFVGKQLLETIPIGPHDAFPDIDAMNEAAPRSEWGIGLNGLPQGPYNRALILKLLDLVTMDRYAFVTKSLGGQIAIGDLSDKTKIRRRLQGPCVTPVVSCRSTLFKTRYNPHDRRPHFEPLRWIELKGDAALAQPAKPLQLTGDQAAPIAPKTEAPIAPATAPLGVTVPEPTMQQELDDKVVF